LLLAFGLALLLIIPAEVVNGQQGKLKSLRIGSSGSLTDAKDEKKEKAALESLESFVKDETGLKSQIQRQKNWRELADKLAKEDLDVGVFRGYEFAWAQEKHSALKPLALAVNVYRYPVVYVVVQRNNPAKDFAALAGQSLALPSTGQGYLRLFVERQAEAKGKKLDAFFSKVKSYENFEDALDDVVDGVEKAAVADRAALEAYKRRKPGRFKQLKEVVHSQPFPPTVVAYYGTHLNDATLKQFRDGLLKASHTERGQTMLTFFRLTGFESVPDDFGKVLAETRKLYPPPKKDSK
jgi:ABC-type phosphate/phosphonate transport system substrate-binding protein